MNNGELVDRICLTLEKMGYTIIEDCRVHGDGRGSYEEYPGCQASVGGK